MCGFPLGPLDWNLILVTWNWRCELSLLSSLGLLSLELRVMCCLARHSPALADDGGRVASFAVLINRFSVYWFTTRSSALAQGTEYAEWIFLFTFCWSAGQEGQKVKNNSPPGKSGSDHYLYILFNCDWEICLRRVIAFFYRYLHTDQRNWTYIPYVHSESSVGNYLFNIDYLLWKICDKNGPAWALWR